MIFIAIAEVLWFECSITDPMFLSFGLIGLSSVVSVCGDIKVAISNSSFDQYEIATEVMGLNVGCVWILLSCISMAAFVFSLRQKAQASDFDSITQFGWKLMVSYVLLQSL